MESYCFIVHQEAYKKTEAYLAGLRTHSVQSGIHLQSQLEGRNPADLSAAEFLEFLNRTRKPQIFAESQVMGDGSDWNLTELSLLGDCGIAVPVNVFDNGMHRHPIVHERPFPATLVFIAGALLRNDNGKTPADWNEVTRKGKIDEEAFSRLYERRPLPALMHCDARAERQG
ncbi:MAG: hypothetical protein ACM3Q4_13780, partial [Acidobacteriota bacterium]